MATGDLEKFIPVSVPGPSTSVASDDNTSFELKLETSRPPSSRASISEEALSPPSQYYSEEEEEEDDSEIEAESDMEIN